VVPNANRDHVPSPSTTVRAVEQMAAYLAAGACRLAGCRFAADHRTGHGRRRPSRCSSRSARPADVQQSKAILDRLKSRGEETHIFDRHRAVEEAIVGSPLVVGNKVILLKDGPDTYQLMITAIRNAKNHIHLEETYIIRR